MERLIETTDALLRATLDRDPGVVAEREEVREKSAGGEGRKESEGSTLVGGASYTGRRSTRCSSSAAATAVAASAVLVPASSSTNCSSSSLTPRNSSSSPQFTSTFSKFSYKYLFGRFREKSRERRKRAERSAAGAAAAAAPDLASAAQTPAALPRAAILAADNATAGAFAAPAATEADAHSARVEEGGFKEGEAFQNVVRPSAREQQQQQNPPWQQPRPQQPMPQQTRHSRLASMTEGRRPLTITRSFLPPMRLRGEGEEDGTAASGAAAGRQRYLTPQQHRKLLLELRKELVLVSRELTKHHDWPSGKK